jgi:hypothetical protein
VIAPPSAAGGGGWKQPFKIESGRGCFAGAPTAFKGGNITGKEGLAVGSVAADRASPEDYSDEGRGCGHAGERSGKLKEESRKFVMMLYACG